MSGSVGGPRLAVAALALLVAGLTVAGPALLAGAGSSERQHLVQVFAASPFDGCADDGAGRNYRGAAVEPRVAAAPATLVGERASLVAVWQQDRWADLGARGIVAGFSFDGGRSWGRVPLPFSRCAPGGAEYQRASDPWVAIGPDGVAYAIGLALTPHGEGLFPNDNAILAASSTDGGQTWSAPRFLASERQASRVFHDKPSVTADPRQIGRAYAVWERLEWPREPPFSSGASYHGPALLATTDDGGATWSTPRLLFDPGLDGEAVGSLLLADERAGALYHLFTWVSGGEGGGQRIALQRSTDGGTSWSEPRPLADLTSVGLTDSASGKRVRGGQRFVAAALDAAAGRLYATWQDGRFSGGQYDEIALARSDDGGATWSAPRLVASPTGGAAFTPSVAVGANGLLALSFYAVEPAASWAGWPTSAWLLLSQSGGERFERRFRLGSSFDLRSAPDADGYFLGDYQGLVGLADGFQAVFARTSTAQADRSADLLAIFTPAR